MSKLTKEQEKYHVRAMELVRSDRPLIEDEQEFVLRNYHAAATNLAGINAAYFTPFNLAHAVAIYALKEGRVVDLGAGIGVLGWWVHRQSFGQAKVTCIEHNPEYVEVGRRVFPEATWICRDVFDLKMWRELGQFDGAVSNPPFGNVKSDKEARAWLTFQGPLHFQVAELVLRVSRTGAVLIFPRIDLPYEESMYRKDLEMAERTRFSRFFRPRTGHRFVEEEKWSRNLKKFMRLHPARFWSTSWPLEGFEDDWQGVNPIVEMTSFGYDDDVEKAERIGIPPVPAEEQESLEVVRAIIKEAVAERGQEESSLMQASLF